MLLACLDIFMSASEFDMCSQVQQHVIKPLNNLKTKAFTIDFEKLMKKYNTLIQTRLSNKLLFNLLITCSNLGNFLKFPK